MYIPHRYENRYVEFSNIFDEDFKLHKIDIPIELYFLLNKIEPVYIISFFSTALFTLKKFFNNVNIEVVKFDLDEVLNDNSRRDIIQCWDMLDKLDNCSIHKITE